jgi:hypothetical protein
MRFNKRTFHDPYEGHGVEVGFTAKSGVQYSIDLGVGFTPKVFEASLEITPPFDTQALNTGGADESVDFKEAQFILARLSILWLSINLTFNRLPLWHKPVSWDWDSMLESMDD